MVTVDETSPCTGSAGSGTGYNQVNSLSKILWFFDFLLAISISKGIGVSSISIVIRISTISSRVEENSISLGLSITLATVVGIRVSSISIGVGISSIAISIRISSIGSRVEEQHQHQPWAQHH